MAFRAPSAVRALSPSMVRAVCQVGGQAVLGRQHSHTTPWLTERHGYDPTSCRFTKQKVTAIGVPCPKCGSRVVSKHGKGRMSFYSCEKYPECNFSSWDMPLNEKCPDCGEMLYYRKSRKSVICKNKACDYKRDEEMTVIE